MELTPEQIQALSGLAAVAPKLMALAGAPAAPAAPVAPAAPTMDTTPAPAAPAAAPVAPKQDEAPPAKTEEEMKTDAKEKAAKEAQLIEQRVNDSLELREQARTVLGPDAVLTGKSNRDIMVEVVKHVDSKFELGNRDETYLRARFDGAIQHHADKQSLQQHMALRGALHTDSTDGANGKPVMHVDSLQAKIGNAWQTKAN